VEVYSSPVTFRNQTLLFSIVQDVTDRKQAEEALRESEMKFKVMSTSAQDAIIMMDHQGQISFWNEAASRIFGYSSAEVLGQYLHTLLAPDPYLTIYQKHIKQFWASGQGNAVGKTLELEALHKGGRAFPIEISMSALQLKGQWHALGILRDITERKQLEAELKQIVTQQEIILEGSVVGIALVKRRVVVWVNKRFAEMFGYTPAEVKGLPTRTFYRLQEEYEQLAQVAYPKLMQGKTYHGEWQMRQRDGSPLWCSINAKAIDPADMTLGTIWLFEDITERKEREATLRKYERIVSATTDQIILVDQAYGCQLVNEAYAFARAKTKADLVGQTLDKIWAPETFQTLIKNSYDLCLEGQLVHRQAWMTYENLGRRFMDVTYIPYLEPDNAVSGVVMSARDITDLKEIEQKLQKANDRFRTELAFARKIQQNLLPPPYPAWPGLKVLCFNAPAREVSGDFYDYLAFTSSSGEPKYTFAVGDVTGKGMPAALLMAVSIALLRSVAYLELSPSLLLTNLDQQLENYTKEDLMNCALCYIEITLLTAENKRVRVRIANGGLIPPFLKPCEGQTYLLSVAGPPLGAGLGEMLGYPEKTIDLAPGEMLILTSDGLVEAMNPQGELLGFERTLDLIQAGPTDAEAMLAYLQTEILTFMDGAEPHDDITIVVVQL
jgi:PAS domain S-box-containing protein